MNEQKKNVLPVDFDGVFRFTNRRDTEFKAKWGGIEYTFPAQKMSPMIIPGATPEEVQNIRKKFAREYAVEQFYKTPKFVGMNASTPGGVPALYTDSDLAPFIQECLEPLPMAQAKMEVIPKDNEARYRKDKKGKNVSRVLEQDETLVEDGTIMA